MFNVTIVVTVETEEEANRISESLDDNTEALWPDEKILNVRVSVDEKQTT